jgi:hypothetical protein
VGYDLVDGPRAPTVVKHVLLDRDLDPEPTGDLARGVEELWAVEPRVVGRAR